LAQADARTGPGDLPPLLRKWRQVLSVSGQVEFTLAVLALIVGGVLSGALALLRYAFGTSLWWAQEIAESLILLTYFLGVSYVFKARQYIIIEFLSLRFPVRAQACLYAFAQVAAIAFTVVIVILVAQFAPRAMGMRSPVLGLPGNLTFLPIAVGSVMMALTSLYYLAFAVWALAAGRLAGSLAATEAQALVVMPQPAEW
jgi:TRAP-type C4-dicarboxylate transport system permease small subunit